MKMGVRGLGAMALMVLGGGVIAKQPPGGPPELKNPGNANGPPPGPMPGAPGGPPLGPRPPDIVARSVSIAVAVELAKAIVVSCKGYHVGVSILDAAGTPKLYYIPEGPGAPRASPGYRKANRAVAFKTPSGPVPPGGQADPSIAA